MKNQNYRVKNQNLKIAAQSQFVQKYNKKN